MNYGILLSDLYNSIEINYMPPTTKKPVDYFYPIYRYCVVEKTYGVPAV